MLLANYRAQMLVQFIGTVLILIALPGNIFKLAAFIVLWSLTFRKLTKSELLFWFGAGVFFTSMDYATLKQGLFRFSEPDFWLMPCYEPLLWGYLLLHTDHFLKSDSPRSSWLQGFGLLVLLCLPYLFLTDQLVLFGITSAIVVGALLKFRDSFDRLYAGYMILLGFIWEYSGVWFGQWSYPDPPPGGVPPWFIPTFAGVGLIYRRMIVPILRG